MSTNKKKRIVVIGGVAAGTSAASKAKRIDPRADVTIIQEEGVVSYGACGIPYVIEGIVNNFEELVERPPDIFKIKYGIDIIIHTRVYKIDRFRKQVHTTDLQSGKETIFDYEKVPVRSQYCYNMERVGFFYSQRNRLKLLIRNK